MNIIENLRLDTERALYGSRELSLVNCRFEGEADGESALKESADISVESCYFDLRYPLWHVTELTVKNSQMTENCRAAIWYSKNITITDSELYGIKALRECRDASISDCDIASPEFGWYNRNVKIENSDVTSEYFMMQSRELAFNNVTLHGKYSFQYIEDGIFENCIFDTKDAFWHSKNVTVKNSIVRGEYLAWYSKALTLINCKIIGTQPFCYCEDLRLIDCEMFDTDLAFEKSTVVASVTTPVLSIKNPRNGLITAPSVGEIIRDDPESIAEIIIKGE